MLREDLVRGAFSFVAAASLSYMATEYVEAYIKTKYAPALVLAGVTAGLAAVEIIKVGDRVERVLGIAAEAHQTHYNQNLGVF